MTSLCPSCREPLDYPSGDGCAAMNRHKDNAMSDPTKTTLTEDQIEAVVITSLMELYDYLNKPNRIDNSDYIIDPDEDLLYAVEVVLGEYMIPSEHVLWLNSKKGKTDE